MNEKVLLENIYEVKISGVKKPITINAEDMEGAVLKVEYLLINQFSHIAGAYIKSIKLLLRNVDVVYIEKPVEKTEKKEQRPVGPLVS